MANFYPAANGDDLKVQVGVGLVDNNAITFGDAGGSPYLYDCYIRFRNVTIPQGATILSAKLTLTGSGNYAGDNCNANIYGNNVDNASVPGDITAYNALALTDPIAWNAVAHITTNTAFDSPSILDIIQTIVNRAGWSSGNALAILVKNNSSSASASREIHSYNQGNSAYYPQLVITYAVSGDLSETVTFSETDQSWNDTERLEEEITFDDELLKQILEEILSEDLTLAETLVPELDLLLTEGFSLSEIVQCPYWFDVISEALNLIDTETIENQNVTWRQEKSINMVGEHIQLRFRNDTLGQGLYLRDAKVYLDRMEDRKAIEAGDYVGEHVKIRFRNNTIDEGLYLEYVRIIAIFRGLRGWQV